MLEMSEMQTMQELVTRLELLNDGIANTQLRQSISSDIVGIRMKLKKAGAPPAKYGAVRSEAKE